MGKRVFDLVVAAAALVVTSPVWAVAALAIKASSRGPVLYRGLRVGREGVPFVLYKFRTMTVDTMESGPGVTGRADPRVTGVGRWLRRWKIDELPNLVNVLRGEISLVGPRPEDPRYVEHYTERQLRVLTVRPGMTSPAAVAYRHEEAMLAATATDLEEAYVHGVMQAKLELDLAYVDQRSFVSELRVLAATVAALFDRGPGSGTALFARDES